MICSLFWKQEGGPAPWGPLDIDASLNFSFDMSSWLAASGSGLTLATAEFVDHPTMTIGAPALADSVVTARVAWLPDEGQRLGAFYSFTLRFTADDGQRDDRTFYLQFTAR